ncbi:GntR family transcriptional regulator [Vallitalea okinawensis]|uniref:GntR family transcriptional regulator n=1 Tax=Vallitalea okinawensis TaxID=2078660 RepID=UPI000CFD95BF|nr:GntR family transcriptional regulator [Vallitalea okinawensis]
MLNKNDVVPLYIQLQRIIKEDILKGEYQQDELIPSETQLSKKYDITRTTVRKAISNLVDEGLLRREHGKGTFVSLRKVNYSIWNFGGFTDFLKKKNKSPISKILDEEFLTMDGRPFYKIVRARGVKEDEVEYLTIDTSFLPLDLFPNIDNNDFSKASIYNTIKTDYHINPARVELGVYPMLSTPKTKEIFSYKEDTPLLQVKGTVFSDEGIEIERVNIIYSPNVEFKMLTRID